MAVGVPTAVASRLDRTVPFAAYDTPGPGPFRPNPGAYAQCHRLVKTYHARLVTVAARLLPVETAHDALQESYQKVFVTLARGFVPQSEWFWLRRVVINTCHDVREREQRHETEPFEEWMFGTLASDPALIVERDVLCAEVRKAVKALPPSQRDILTMTALDGLSFYGGRRPHGRFNLYGQVPCASWTRESRTAAHVAARSRPN